MAIKQRICYVCRTKKPVTDLIRVARIRHCERSEANQTHNANPQYLIDTKGNANGRGCYIEPTCLEKAIKTRALNKSFKANVPQEIYDTLAKFGAK